MKLPKKLLYYFTISTSIPLLLTYANAAKIRTEQKSTYTFKLKKQSRQQLIKKQKALSLLNEKWTMNDFGSNPETGLKYIRKINKGNIANIIKNFNANGSWKKPLTKVNPNAKAKNKNNKKKKKKSLGNTYFDHTQFFNELFALAYSYKFKKVKLVPNAYQNPKIKLLVYNAINWYFSKKLAPAPAYHGTFNYHAPNSTVAPALCMVGTVLEDEINFERKTNKTAALVYKNIYLYGRQIINSEPQRRGPNWSFRLENSLLYVFFTKDPRRMDEYMHYIDESLTFNKVQYDGVHPDWSMMHHGDMNYWGMYGQAWTNRMIELGELVQNSPWEYNKREIVFLENCLIEGVRWILYRGNTEYTTAPKRGSMLLARTDHIAKSIIELTKRLITLGGNKLNRVTELQKMVDNITPSMEKLDQYKDKQEIIGHKYYWTTEYQVHRRNNYSIAVKRNSQRSRAPEDSAVKGGVFHLHYGSGYTSILRRGDESRFSRFAWNWNALPGTTLEQNSSVSSGKAASKIRGMNLFSGGISDGLYGCGAFEQMLVSFGSKKGISKKVNGKNTSIDIINGATAFKGNFFFNDGMVALGQNIKIIAGDKKKAEVWTTLNQTMRRSEIVYSIDNAPPITITNNQQKIAQLTPTKTMWVWHDKIGYIINKINQKTPLNIVLSAKRQQLQKFLKTDKDFKNAIKRSPWKADYNKNSFDMFFLYINHGIKPNNDKYEYFVVPDKSLTEFTEYVKKHGNITVAENSNNIEAVNQGDNLYYAIFRKAGIATFANGKKIAVQVPLIVMVKKENNSYKVSVANPMHLGTRREYVPGYRKTVGIAYPQGVKIKLMNFSKTPKVINFKFSKVPLADGATVTKILKN